MNVHAGPKVVVGGERARQGAAWLRALAHPTRLTVCAALFQGPKCVHEIGQLVDIPQPNLSQHLAVLRSAGLIDCYADANLRCYFLTRPSFVGPICRLLADPHPTSSPTRDEVCAVRRSRTAHCV